MTEYVTPMISSVLKKYQNSATKSLQGPAVALIKKEILSSPEPHELHQHTHDVAATVSATYAAHLPLPPELSQPILSQPDSGCGELFETRLEGKTIGCFSLGGEMRLCLPQFLNNVLNDFTLEQINRIFDDLGIYCSQCTPDQLVEFKAAKILPSDVKASGLITRTDAERLCAALLHRSDRNSYVPVESLAKGALSFQVYHKCFGKCEGICTPDMYSYQKPTCIKCLECEGWFSPQKFVGHVHRKFENRTCHWGFDSRNWHEYLHVALDVENREKYQRILDQLKEVELKEMHKAQCELDHKKRKAEMLMEDALLVGQLNLVAPQPPSGTHQSLPASLKPHHQLHHLPRGGVGVGGATSAAGELLDIPSKKLKTMSLDYPQLQHYRMVYAHCMQQHQREREQQQQRAVGQQLASSAFQPWRSAKQPPAAYMQAYALSSLPYACQEPPELQNPERVVRSTGRECFEPTYQPNVALAPRKSKERVERLEQRELQLHIKQERPATPPAATEPQNVVGGSSNSSSNHSNHSSNSSNHSSHSNHSNSSNSSSPMPKPAPAHLPAPPPPPPTHTAPTAAPPTARHVPRSPADEFSAGSNEITSSTSPVPAPHIIATVNQHAKLLPTSSNHNNHNEPSRIRINKNLMSQQPTAAAVAVAATIAVVQQPPSGVFYKTPPSAGYSPTQSSSAGLNLSTHSSNVVSSPHTKQLQLQQHPLLPQQQQQFAAGPLQNGNGIVKPHLGSEFELSTDTDDDSLNGEPDSSAMLPPWELAVEALRDTRPKNRERVLHLVQRLLQENQQNSYSNVQLSELCHKQEAHILELREQLQRCRRQLDALDKLRVVPLKQTLLGDVENEVEPEDPEEEEEEEMMLPGDDADSNETLTQDQANNNNHNNHNNNNNNGEKVNGLRRSPTRLNCCTADEQHQLPPASKRIRLQPPKEEDEESEKSEKTTLQLQNGHGKSLSPSAASDEEEEEDEEEMLDDELVQAPHSSALATPPTATTPISPDSAATAGQLFDSSNSSDESSMKKAQMSACQALSKITNNNNNSEQGNEEDEEDEEEQDEEEEEEERERERERERKQRQANDDSDDDELPLQQRQQHQRRLRCDTTPTETPAAIGTPILMATKASKKQTPPTPTSTPTPMSTPTPTPTPATTTTTTNCEIQIKKEIV